VISAWAWVVIVVVVLVVIAVVVGVVGGCRRARRTEHLQSTFGPEYYRVALDRRGRPSRKGEEELRRREEQRARLEIRPLSSPQEQRYLRAWRDIQTTFVDTPQRSVAEAETLVTQVMEARGYPVDDFEKPGGVDLGGSPRLGQQLPPCSPRLRAEPARGGRHGGAAQLAGVLPVAVQRAVGGLTRPLVPAPAWRPACAPARPHRHR
jgi:hypothetical protein